MPLSPKVGLLLFASVASCTMLAGCGHSEANVSTATVTLGASGNDTSPAKSLERDVVRAARAE